MISIAKKFGCHEIHVYGTYDEPLFKAKEIGTLLKIENIIKTVWELDKHYKVLKIAQPEAGEEWFLTEDGLYEVLFNCSNTSDAKQFKVGIRKVIKELRLQSKHELEQQLHQKTQELQLYKKTTYEDIQTTGSVYIMETDAFGAHKVGKAKDSYKRVKGLQTGNVSDIKVLFDFPTSNPDILEKVVHYILDRYRCNSNREFFNCNVEYIKLIVTICGNVIDTLKSTFQHITPEEVLCKLKEKGVETNALVGRVPQTVGASGSGSPIESDFYIWLGEYVQYKSNVALKLKSICQMYLSKKDIPPREAERHRKEVERFVKNTFPQVNWKYQDSTMNSERYKGWANLALKKCN